VVVSFIGGGNRRKPLTCLIVRQLDLQLPMLSVTIIINIVNLNPAHGEVCSILHFVIKFVGHLRQVDGFLQFPQLIKLTGTVIAVLCFTVTVGSSKMRITHTLKRV
jgi:hypothetical protein